MSESRPPPPEPAAGPAVAVVPTTAELLAKGYQRWFDPLHAYVSRHVVGRHVQVRIVREVLSENLDLLVGRRDQASEISRLKATANRLIAEVLTGEDVSRSLLHGPNPGGSAAHVAGPTPQPRPR
jgi:hypothetical protein